MSRMKTSLKKSQPSVHDKVQTLDKMDSLEFGKLDAEMRNALQGIKLADYEIQDVRAKANERITFLELNKQKLQASIGKMTPEYGALLKRIAKKHGIDDPQHLVLDPDSGIVRDARSLTARE